MANEQNLRPFPKGVSGNPGGRRPGLSLTRFIRNELEKPFEDGSPVTKGEKFAEVVVAEALNAHPVWGPLVWRYVDGDPKAVSELSLRDLITSLAEKMGLDPDALYAEFTREMKQSGAA